MFRKLLLKDIPKPLGRWKIENCNKQINNKIDLSNEDHCGPCGQYAKKKIELHLSPLKQVESSEVINKKQ